MTFLNRWGGRWEHYWHSLESLRYLWRAVEPLIRWALWLARKSDPRWKQERRGKSAIRVALFVIFFCFGLLPL